MNSSNLMHKAGGLLIRNRAVLLERHGGRDVYIVPGGKLEPGETARQALIRELMEEFQITVSSQDFQEFGIFKSRAMHNPDSFVSIETFLVAKWSGEIKLSGGIEAVVWVNSKNAKQYNLSTITTNNILPLLLEKGLID